MTPVFVPANLRAVLDAVVDRVDTRKLKQLESKLENALGMPLSAHIVKDPMVIRKRLADHLRSEGFSAGAIQSIEQFFMGVIRRAALEGLVPVPPEGPWTREWQSVLDFASTIPRARAPLRSLAAWASHRSFSPKDMTDQRIELWMREQHMSKQLVGAARLALGQWSPIDTAATLKSDRLSTERLRLKALQGTIQQPKLTTAFKAAPALQRHDS